MCQRPAFYAGITHDVGKLLIDKTIIHKPAALTETEYMMIKCHTTNSIVFLKSATQEQKDAALYHHEKMDGTGYPKGLRRTEIPLIARIVAIADVFEARTAKRSYKKAIPYQQVIEFMAVEDIHGFDTFIFEAFRNAMKKYPETIISKLDAIREES